MALLKVLCAVFAALIAFELNTRASAEDESVDSRRFKIPKKEVAQPWQSSDHGSRCFLDRAALGATNGFGYQWLLMQLTRPMRVLSVTVYGRPETTATEGIEISLSHEMPAGLNSSGGRCIATVSNTSDSSLTQCGVTTSERSPIMQRVTCGYSGCTKMTKFILLRRNVENIHDKFLNLNFIALQVEVAKSSGEYIEPRNVGTEFRFSFITNDARPSITSHTCRLVTDGKQNKNNTAGLALHPTCEKLLNGSTSSHKMSLVSEFNLGVNADTNGKSISCTSKLQGASSDAKVFQVPNIVVRSQVDLKGSTMSGNTVLVHVNVTDGNPSPRVNCSLLTDSGIRYPVVSNSSLNSDGFRFGTHSVQVEIDKRSLTANITCSVTQEFAEFRDDNDYIFQVKSSVATTSRYASPSAHSSGSPAGGAFFASFGSLLALGLVFGVVLVSVNCIFLRLWFRFIGGREVAGSNSDGSGAGRIETPSPMTRKRSGSPDAETEFMRTHNLFTSTPPVEYATVVKGQLTETDLADSTETIYLTIVGHLDSEDVEPS